MSKAATKIRIRKMKAICYSLGVSVVEININSFRLYKNGFPTIDVYPKSLKTFNLEDKMWGEIANLETFLRYQFQF